MRSLKATLGFLAVFLMLASPAYAWWGWLDDLSGPGPFWGQQYEIRVACFGPTDQTTKDLADYLFTAKVLTYRSTTGANAEVMKAWTDFADVINRTKALSALDVARFKTALTTFSTTPAANATARTSSAVGTASQLPGASSPIQRMQIDPPAANLIEVATLLVEQSYKANMSINSSGMFWSLCSPDSTRRVAVETGLTFWQANSNPEFAKDYSVRLITFMPSISYRLFKDPSHDMLDVGAGAGIYWFSSRGFERFSGLLLQPARVDFHAPTEWVNAGGLKSAVSLITLRAAIMGFPSGFDAGAFGPGSKAIGADFRPTLTVFFDAAPLLRRPALK